MLSEATTAVVTPPPPTPSILMRTAAEIAERDGVTKQAVTKKVREYADKGLTVERDAKGHIVRFNIAEYDHLRGKIGHADKDQRKAAAADELPKADPKESYDEALRQRTWHEAERKRIELAEIKGDLVRKDRYEAALETAAEAIVKPIDALAGHADELALAHERDGAHGLRVALKRLAASIRGDIAKALAEISDRAPLHEIERDELAT